MKWLVFLQTAVGNSGYSLFYLWRISERASSARLPKVPFLNFPALLLGVSVKTIYDWRYRQKLRGVPDGLFLKINRLLYLRTEVLRQWIRSQNPTL